MKIDKNHHQALTQVAEKVREACEALCAASCFMLENRPSVALERLEDAKSAVEGAMISARWAKTLPDSEEG
jgi:hypothetical protein